MRSTVHRGSPTPALLAAALFLWVATGHSTAAAGQQPRVVELAEGAWALLQAEEARFDDCNSAFVIGRRGVLVVDPPSALAASASLLEAIAERTDLPVRWIVNTHWHGDHTEGNRAVLDAFGPEVRVLGHDSLRIEVPERAATAHAEQVARYRAVLPQARRQLVDGLRRDGSPLSDADREAVREGIAAAERWLAEHAAAEFVPPSLTYDEALTVHADRRVVRLLHFRGHTAGDTAVFLEEDGVLIAGDLVDELPYVGHGYPSDWHAALAALGGLEPRVVVPGHGPLFHGREQLDRISGYLEALVSRAERAVREGESLEEVLRTTDLARWRDRLASGERAAAFFDAVRDEALERALAEAAETLDRRAPPPPR